MTTLHALRSVQDAEPTPDQQEYMRLLGKTVPPAAKRDELITKAHNQGHYGEQAIVDMIYNNWGFWWPTLRRDALRAVRQCTQCQRHNITTKGYHPMRSPTAFMPGDHWQLDLMELPTSINGYSHVLCVLDLFTSYLLTRPLKTKSAEETAQALLALIGDWGPPKVVQSDMGGEFDNKVLRALLEQMNVEFHISAPKYHGSTGRVERTIRTLRFSLRKMLQGAMGLWDVILPLATFYYNITARSLHKSSPYVLMFTREYNKNDPDDWVPVDQTFDDDSYDEWLGHQMHTLSEIYPHIREAVEIKRDHEAKRFNGKRKRNLPPLKIGDQVLLLDSERHYKDAARTVGPWVIANVRPTGTYEIRDGINQTLLRHRSHLELIPIANAPAPALVAAPNVETSPPTNPVRMEEDEKATTVPDADPIERKEPPLTVTPDTFVVENIMAHRGSGKRLEYLVKWSGYNHEDNTWEPIANFYDTDCITAYWQRLAPQRTTKKQKRGATASKLSNKRRKQ